MKYSVELLHTAERELKKLSTEDQNRIISDYRVIEEFGIEGVSIKQIRGKLYEIRTGKIRSLFIHKGQQVIIIGLIFTKKTNQTPKRMIETAIKRFSDYL